MKSDLHDGIDGTEIVLTLKLEIARAILKREEGLSLKRVSNIFLIIIMKKNGIFQSLLPKIPKMLKHENIKFLFPHFILLIGPNYLVKIKTEKKIAKIILTLFDIEN